jgi:hypothetical protein
LGLMKPDPNKRLITITMITSTSFHCAVTVTELKKKLLTVDSL